MKKALKRLNIAIIVALSLLGVAFGVALTLLIFTLTNDSSGLSLGGLIALLVSIPVALVLLFLVRAREMAIARLEKMEEIFGKGNEILTKPEFISYLKKRKCQADKVYALHMKLGKGYEEDEARFARLSLCDLLYEMFHEYGVIAYTGEADFLFVIEDKVDLPSTLKEIDRHLKRNPRVISYAIYLGVATLRKKEAAKCCENAISASYADTAIRAPLSINSIKGKGRGVDKIDFAKELEAKRLRFPAIDYVDSKNNHLYYLMPELYDPSRGPIRDKDFRSFVAMSGQEEDVTRISLDKALESLSEGLLTGPIGVEVSLNELLDPSFVPKISEALLERKLKLKKLVIFVPSSALNNHDAKLGIDKLNGMRIPFGVYEYGEEKLADLAKLKPLYVRFKSEYVRKGADEKLLLALISAVRELGITPLLKRDDLLGDTLDFKEGERVSLEKEILPELEEEEEEDKKEEAEE